MSNLLSIKTNFNAKSLRDFADQLSQLWEENKNDIIDNENKWWIDEIELEYYEDLIYKENFSKKQSKYVLSYLGY